MMRRARPIAEIVVTHTPTAWPSHYFGDAWTPGCRASRCYKRPRWCIRFYYHGVRVWGTYPSHYWCDDHLPTKHRARSRLARASEKGIFRQKFPKSEVRGVTIRVKHLDEVKDLTPEQLELLRQGTFRGPDEYARGEGHGVPQD